MGHLFSRAFKRLTQSSNNNNQTARQSTQANQQEQQDNERKPIVESIPVGQSIDSAEYRALEPGFEGAIRSQEETVEEDDEPAEKAAIKIQALVRGHLTRKALKDAHQHSAPLPNAIGQSQFDEQSLTQNPPSAVFLSATNVNRPTNQLVQLNKQSSSSSDIRSPLESIAELIESQPVSKTDEDQNEDEEEEEEDLSSDIRIRSDSGARPPIGSASGSARASIDLSSSGGGETSASILISDHNVKPNELFASVLHQASGGPNELVEETRPRIGDVRAPPEAVEEDEGVAALGSPDSLESEEAAAIRIQSAFRGYRTRKNSPYRTRSPQNKSPHSCSTHSNSALIVEQEEAELRLSAQDAGRRESRPRRRGSSGELRSELAQSVDELTSTEELDNTVKEQLYPPSKSAIDAELDKSMRGETETSVEHEPLDELAILPSVSSSTVANQQRAHSDSLATDDEMALSAALEAAPTDDLPVSSGSARASIGANKSLDTSVELDTDSSVLGAALCLSETDQLNQVEQVDSRLELVDEGCNEQLDEDRSPGELMRRESSELTSSDLAGNLNSTTNELEAALDDEVFDDEQQTNAMLNEEEQLAIELESDDIERRDPRGFICEDRAKSPQVPETALTWPATVIPATRDENLPQIPKLELPEGNSEEPASGQSTVNSSTAGNSSASDADSGDEAGQSPQPQQTNNRQQQSNNKTNKRKNNRNKRKGKK